MAKFILHSMPNFDSLDIEIFKFSYKGNKVAGTRLKIYNAESGVLVSATTDTQHAFKSEHHLPSGTLVNGIDYEAVLYVSTYNANSTVTDYIEESNRISFSCKSSPHILFNNASVTINKSSYNFDMTYNQEQNDPLYQYTITLVDNSSGKEKYNSGVLYCNDPSVPLNLSNSIYNLEEGIFTLIVSGQSASGISFFSSTNNVNIKYTKPRSFNLITAENKSQIKSVEIATQYKIITGKTQFESKAKYVTYNTVEKGIDLTNDIVVFENFGKDSDFTVIGESSYMKIDELMLTILGGDYILYVYPKYELLYDENAETKNFKKFYIQAIAENNQLKNSLQKLKSVAVSNYINDVNDNLVYSSGRFNNNKNLSFWITRKNGLIDCRISISDISGGVVVDY